MKILHIFLAISSMFLAAESMIQGEKIWTAVLLLLTSWNINDLIDEVKKK